MLNRGPLFHFNKNVFYKLFNIAMWHVSIPRSLEDVADLRIPLK
jgi:hypothetical protein